MATYTLIPTQQVIADARSQNRNPIEYLLSKTIGIPKNAGYDERKMDKFRIDYLEDLMITRSDGTRVILHEIPSDIEKFKKVELSEVDRKNVIVQKILAYTDGLDFSKMQSEPEYLNCLGDSLISQQRLFSKQQMAKNYGLDEIYIGSVQMNHKTGRYGKFALAKDDVVLSQIADAKRELKHQKEMQDRENKIRQNKSKMISAINSRLTTLSTEELSSICNQLNISLDALDLDDAR